MKYFQCLECVIPRFDPAGIPQVRPFLSLQASNLFSPGEIGRLGSLLEEEPGIYATVSKFLFFTAVRVSELVRIKVSDVDLGHCKVFIEEAKGTKDRYILFPASFRLALKSHLQANPKNRYLFETSRCGPFTPRRIQQIVQSYREQVGIIQPVHPHLFRHQMITYLTSWGLSDAQIQLISGHESKKSLEVYQHLSLKTVENAYQEAVRSIGI